MGYAVRTFLPLVTTPDDSTWSFRADSRLHWRNHGFASYPTGKTRNRLCFAIWRLSGRPAAADVKTWSGLQGAQTILDALRPKLLVVRDERKRELFDLPEAAAPGGRYAGAPRFIAAFDNLVLSHADRSRIVPAEHRSRITTRNLQVLPTVLLDGFVAGTWQSKASKRRHIDGVAVRPPCQSSKSGAF